MSDKQFYLSSIVTENGKHYYQRFFLWKKFNQKFDCMLNKNFINEGL